MTHIRAFLTKSADALRALFVGRLDRRGFLCAFILGFVAPLAAYFLVVLQIPFLAQEIKEPTSAGAFLVMIPLCAAAFLFQGAFVRRLHDFGVPGWIALIPVASHVMNILAFFIPGQGGDNAYGKSRTGVRSLRGVLVNTDTTETDHGERWLAPLSLLLFDLLILLAFLTAARILPIEIEFNGHGYMIDMQKSFNVEEGNAKIICFTGELDIVDAPAIAELDLLINSLVATCGGHFDAEIFYGDGTVYLVVGRNHPGFSKETPYLAVLVQQGWDNEDTNELSLAVYYKENERFMNAYRDWYGPTASIENREDELMTFADVDSDGRTDLQVYAPTPGSSSYHTYFSVPNTHDFTAWMHADSSTNYSYLVTDTAVYYDGRKLLGADPASFTILDYKYAKDRARVYLYGESAPYLDASSFMIVDRESYSQYTKDKHAVYYYDDLLPGADPATFEHIAASYSKDAQRVYLNSMRIPGADPATFEFVFDASNSFSWSKDRAHVYHGGSVVEGAQPRGFEAISSTFGVDGKTLFRETTRIDGADVHTLDFLTAEYPLYLKDKQQVYIDLSLPEGPVISGADPASFVVLGDSYAKDAAHVYYENRRVDGADPHTFEILSGYGWPRYTKDKNHVYADEQILEDADPATFVVPDSYDW